MYLGDVITCMGAILAGIGVITGIFFLTTGKKRREKIEQLMRERY